MSELKNEKNSMKTLFFNLPQEANYNDNKMKSNLYL